MLQHQATVEMPSETQIVIKRVVNGPAAFVWRAWTEPDLLSKWWGPVGFTTTTHEIDVRPGGQWRYVMHGPDGQDYDNVITYREVTKPTRLVYKHGGDVDCIPVNFETTATFKSQSPDGDTTLVTLSMTFADAAARDYVIREYNAAEGGKQTITRLNEFVESMIRSERGGDVAPPFVLTRVFDAPRELVWKAWTEESRLKAWFGPKGMPIAQCTLDLRCGGIFHYCMKGADGGGMWAKWIFKEIDPPNRLSYVLTFSNPEGDTVPAPFEGDWPMEMSTVVSFADHAGRGKGTVVTITSEAINASDAQRKTFTDAHESMTQGWSGTMDQLMNHLLPEPSR